MPYYLGGGGGGRVPQPANKPASAFKRRRLLFFCYLPRAHPSCLCAPLSYLAFLWEKNVVSLGGGGKWGCLRQFIFDFGAALYTRGRWGAALFSISWTFRLWRRSAWLSINVVVSSRRRIYSRLFFRQIINFPPLSHHCALDINACAEQEMPGVGGRGMRWRRKVKI